MIKIDLSIIILNYNGRGLVRNCLKGIKALNLPLNYEVIVVDNASTDKSVEMVEKDFTWAKLIKSKKKQRLCLW